MSLPIVQIDAFTDQPFRGNPAAVCFLPEPKPDVLLQNIAREMNLSETAFLLPEGDGFRLRWFTSTVEVALCGHATLASAHLLWEEGHLAPEETARFYTRSGLLTAERAGDWIELGFPAKPEEESTVPEGLARALGAEPVYVGRSQFDLLVELESEATVRELKPDFGRLERVSARGIIVTARADSERYDFVSRFFGPRVGVPEDPVTGSAHCVLGPYWQKRLGTDDFIAYQASARGGTVRVGVRGDRVRLGGKAVTVMRGELLS